MENKEGAYANALQDDEKSVLSQAFCGGGFGAAACSGGLSGVP